MKRRASIYAIALVVALAATGESSAMPVPVSTTANWMNAGPLLTPVAARQRNRKLIRKRKHQQPQNQPHKPQSTPDTRPQTTPQTTPDKKPDKRPHRKPKHRKPVMVKSKPAIICIDGRPSGRSCLCAGKNAALRIAPGVLQCAAPKASPTIAAPGNRRVNGTAAAARANATPSGPSQAQADRLQAVPGEILVSIDRAAAPAIETVIAQRYGLQRQDAWPIELISQRIVRYRIPDGRSVAAVLASMQSDGQIVASQPNYLYHRLAGAGSSSSKSLQYALAKLKVSEAHELSRGRGTRIAIIDSGIDKTHPDLAGIVAEAFAAAGDADAVPVDPHGTEVGGIVGAKGAIDGVAPEAMLLDVRVFDYDSDSEMAASSIAVLRGLDWASSRKAAVINMSLSGPADTLLQKAISALVHNGSVVVAAAGNDGADAPAAFPAAYDDVIAVTATDSTDGLYAQANRGAYIDVAAPGVDVLSPSLDNAYAMTSGTSFAAAHVSGVVALMLSRNPGMAPADVRRALESSAADLGPPGVDSEFGAGLVNALNALR